VSTSSPAGNEYAPLSASNLFSGGIFGNASGSFDPMASSNPLGSLEPNEGTSLAYSTLAGNAGNYVSGATNILGMPSTLDGANIGNLGQGSSATGTATLSGFLGGSIYNIAAVVIGLAFVAGGVYGLVK